MAVDMGLMHKQASSVSQSRANRYPLHIDGRISLAVGHRTGTARCMGQKERCHAKWSQSAPYLHARILEAEGSMVHGAPGVVVLYAQLRWKDAPFAGSNWLA